MTMAGRQRSPGIDSPIQPAVVPAIAPVVPTIAPVVPAAIAPIVPAAIVPATVAPTTIAPATVAPPAIAPPGKLCLRIDGDEGLAVLATLLDGIGHRGAYRLQPLGDIARLARIRWAILRKCGVGIGRDQRYRKTEGTRRQQSSQSANGTTILSHAISF